MQKAIECIDKRIEDLYRLKSVSFSIDNKYDEIIFELEKLKDEIIKKSLPT